MSLFNPDRTTVTVQGTFSFHRIMTDTTGTDDQQSDDMPEDNERVPAEGPAKRKCEKEAPYEGAKPWPGSHRRNDSSLWDRLRNLCDMLSYSYMNPILDKGSKQTLDDGTHLSPENLYRVPTSMEAAFLEDKFE